MFGKDFKILKEIPREFCYKKIGIDYPEHLYLKDDNGELDYCIMDDNFGQPSPANHSSSDYAQLMRHKSSEILQTLIDNEYIEVI